MEIVKSLFLGIWLASFGTLAYLYLALYRKLPPSTAVGVSVFKAYMTHNLLWWLGLAVCFALGFVIVKAWPGRPAFWIALGVTELFPVALVVMFLKLAARNREVIERMTVR